MTRNSLSQSVDIRCVTPLQDTFENLAVFSQRKSVQQEEGGGNTTTWFGHNVAVAVPHSGRRMALYALLAELTRILVAARDNDSKAAPIETHLRH
ncbi:hypothetical protein E2C01_069920 [Portunus trituberculatus]|uniref:Uncharacterized protein n=1 Tax=Portunus trituberculatus TaxID=210409 RepID=A0A5B7HSU8_PORTR|nr:hypothetical protein [Portunus trituberculatus]